jgi:peptide-methionine (S)-S-oxide reductase
MNPQNEIATLAGGCFWCTEAIFKRLNGVVSVTPGYSGGSVENPTYGQICTGNTGHAEAIQIKFIPELIPFTVLLDIFWHTHDPTTSNRQGNDFGPQYRSAIFYHNEKQKEIAENSKLELEKSNTFGSPIVTEIVPFSAFYSAEEYHKNYYDTNSAAPYCRLVIDPKIYKLMEMYRSKMKPSYLPSSESKRVG